MQLTDTIAAVASAPGPAARSIIRVSGPLVAEIARQTLTSTQNWDDVTRARKFDAVMPLQLEDHAVDLPVAFYYWPTIRSFTGQVSAELHVLGSPPIVEAVLARVLASGARPARRGEFTLRAFLAGHLDLVQAEAVLGAIDAADHEELTHALKQLAGGVSGRIQTLRSDLLNLLADLEAGLDFVDEDIEFVSQAEVIRRLEAGRENVGDLLRQTHGRMHTSLSQRVVLAGDPNSGKSTLFNRLVGREAAIVSAQAGTTRDYLVQELSWRGVTFELVDTAGWEDDRQGIEAAAQELRLEQLRVADVVVWCIAQDVDPASFDDSLRRFAQFQQQHPQALLVLTKTDLCGSVSVPPTAECRVLALSSLTGAGIEELLNVLHDAVKERRQSQHELIGSTAARAADSLRRADDALNEAAQAARDRRGDEVVAVEIRDALDALGEIVGAVVTDDLLDRIFSRFCIGK